MPRIKAVTDARGNKFYPSSITHAVYDTERNQKLTATLTDLYNALYYQDVYIGTAIASATVVSSTYHHDSIMRGRPTTITGASNNYLWVILPSSSNDPVVQIGGTDVPMTLDGTTDINSTTYNVWKSTNLYVGTFNVYLF